MSSRQFVHHPSTRSPSTNREGACALLCSVFGLALTTTGCAEGEDPQQGDWPFGPAVSKRVEPEVAFSELEGEWGHGRFFIGETRQEFHYEMKAGLAIAEGDIILGRVDELTPTQRGVEGVAEAAVHTSKFWEDGVVPYVFDEEIPDYARTAFLEAIQHWEEEAFGITFVERTDEEDYLRVLVRGGAWSYLGRVGGEQEISVGASRMGIAAHEIGHALGLYHEQSRSDRDEHVIVYWDNIWDGKGYNFETHVGQGDPLDAIWASTTSTRSCTTAVGTTRAALTTTARGGPQSRRSTGAGLNRIDRT